MALSSLFSCFILLVLAVVGSGGFEPVILEPGSPATEASSSRQRGEPSDLSEGAGDPLGAGPEVGAPDLTSVPLESDLHPVSLASLPPSIFGPVPQYLRAMGPGLLEEAIKENFLGPIVDSHIVEDNGEPVREFILDRDLIVRTVASHKRANDPPEGFLGVYEQQLLAGLRFPLPALLLDSLYF